MLIRNSLFGWVNRLRNFSTLQPPSSPNTTALPRIKSTKKVNNTKDTPKEFPLKYALSKINSQQPNVYAKLLIHNFPFSVVKTDIITLHRMKDVQVGDVILIDKIREVGSKDYKLRGTPLLPKGTVQVKATVLEHTHGAWKRAKMRKQRKGRRPMRAIKPKITTLRVQDIIINPQFTNPTTIIIKDQ